MAPPLATDKRGAFPESYQGRPRFFFGSGGKVTINAFVGLLLAILTSWQMKTIFGLILLDVALGIAASLRSGTFQWKAVAAFYKTNIVPYIVGYGAFHLVVSFLIPPDALGGLGDTVNSGMVTLAWGALVAALVSSIKTNVETVYRPPAQPYENPYRQTLSGRR